MGLATSGDRGDKGCCMGTGVSAWGIVTLWGTWDKESFPEGFLLEGVREGVLKIGICCDGVKSPLKFIVWSAYKARNPPQMPCQKPIPPPEKTTSPRNQHPRTKVRIHQGKMAISLSRSFLGIQIRSIYLYHQVYDIHSLNSSNLLRLWNTEG